MTELRAGYASAGNSLRAASPECPRLRMALQKKGRLAADSLELLRRIGLDFECSDGRLFSPCSNFPLELLFLRDDDIPEVVQDGVADVGIVGRNVVEEKGGNVESLSPLGFGACRLDIAVRAGGKIQELRDLQGKRIATSYPVVLGRYLKAKGLDALVVEISGSVEIAPMLNVSEAICDLVSTGSTLRMHGLQSIATVLESEAVLIADPGQLEQSGPNSLIQRLQARLESCLQARGMRYLMMNARRSDWEGLRAVLPHLSSPTVVPLARPGWIAIHSAVPEEQVWDVIEDLRVRGARDILCVPIQIMVTG